MHSESLVDIFRSTAQIYGAGPAIIFGDRVLDYAALNLFSDRVAGTLAERGIKKGDRVGLYCPNSDAFVIAYLAIIKGAAAVVPVNLLLNPKEIAFIFNDAEISALIYHEAFSANVAQIKPLVSSLKTLIFIGTNRIAPDDMLWSELIACDKIPPAVAVNPAEDLAAILYTSGTTGRPKGAMLTHRNLGANTRSVRDALKLAPGSERLVVVLPMFHAFAATAGMLSPLLYGGAIVPLPRFEPQQVAETIERTRATIFLGVPSMYVALLRLPDHFTAKFAPLKFCVSGGAALPVAIMEQFEKRFGKLIYEGDGPTECSPVTCVNPIGGKRKPGTVGKSIPGVEMKIMDEAGRELPHGQIGELCVRGANVMKGYWRLPEETKQAFFGEWFRTGDLGTEDDEGYFSILDRRKDMIIVNGMNIYPRIIEEVIIRFPGVRECAVVGEPHPLHGEIPLAYFSTAEGKEISDHDLRAFCLDNLGRHEVPRKFIFMRELPKNASGKIMKRELRRQGEVERGIV
jgi:long-chain acyl-CoA synthetase